MLENVRILYADDDPGVLSDLAYMTEKFGWIGDQARSATEVVKKVNEHCTEGTDCYDAIITAISFFAGTDHALTGVTAAKLIRKAQADIPIIFLSTHSNTILREEVRRVEAEIVTKPIDFEALFHKVERLISWHRATKQSSYEGTERRVLSINTSPNFRRSTDIELTVPPRLKQILQEVNTNERGTTKQN
jgi:DNA-binding response OmpR family regulator